MNRFSLESPSAMRMVHCESTIWGAKEALYYSSLVSHSANDASLVMPIKSYCYELNLYDLSAEKQVCQLRQKMAVSTQSIFKLHSRLPSVCLLLGHPNKSFHRIILNPQRATCGG